MRNKFSYFLSSYKAAKRIEKFNLKFSDKRKAKK